MKSFFKRHKKGIALLSLCGILLAIVLVPTINFFQDVGIEQRVKIQPWPTPNPIVTEVAAIQQPDNIFPTYSEPHLHDGGKLVASSCVWVDIYLNGYPVQRGFGGKGIVVLVNNRGKDLDVGAMEQDPPNNGLPHDPNCDNAPPYTVDNSRNLNEAKQPALNELSTTPCNTITVVVLTVNKTGNPAESVSDACKDLSQQTGGEGGDTSPPSPTLLNFF